MLNFGSQYKLIEAWLPQIGSFTPISKVELLYCFPTTINVALLCVNWNIFSKKGNKMYQNFKRTDLVPYLTPQTHILQPFVMSFMDMAIVISFLPVLFVVGGFTAHPKPHFVGTWKGGIWVLPPLQEICNVSNHVITTTNLCNLWWHSQWPSTLVFYHLLKVLFLAICSDCNSTLQQRGPNHERGILGIISTSLSYF